MIKKILSLLFISSFVSAGQITHTDYVSGNVITAAGQNANENTIVNVINGNLDTTNLSASAGIVGSQLSGTAGITGSQIANQTITSGNISNGTLNTNQITNNTLTGSTANSGGSAGNIAQGTISTPDFRTNAISMNTFTSTGNNSQGYFTFISSASITTIGKTVLLIGNVIVNPASGQVVVSITRNGVALGTGGYSVFNTNGTNLTDVVIPILGSDTPSAGSYTYELSANNGTIIASQFYALELRN